jgi:hypothetical protein
MKPKLRLARETVRALQSDELGEVNGGTTPAITASSMACAASAWSLGEAAYRYFLHTRWCRR